MGEPKIILFDLPSKGESHCWSYNPWKARLALNFKELPYETRWTEYPDIAPLFQSFGIPPNPAGSAETPYSIPAVLLPDGRHIMGSMNIAEALESLRPDPSLHLESPRVERMEGSVKALVKALGAIAKPRVPEIVLNPSSAEYFRRTRAQRLGMSLEELARSESAGEAAWTEAGTELARVKALLAEDRTGPFAMGSKAGFADFILAGFWRFMQVLDRDGDLFGRLMEYDESFPRHFAACKKWLERDT